MPFSAQKYSRKVLKSAQECLKGFVMEWLTDWPTMKSPWVPIKALLSLKICQFSTHQILCFLHTFWPVSYSPNVVFPTHILDCFLLTNLPVSYSPNAVFPTHHMLCFLLTFWPVSYSHFDLFPTHKMVCFLLVSYSFPTHILWVGNQLFHQVPALSQEEVAKCAHAFLRSKTLL